MRNLMLRSWFVAGIGLLRTGTASTVDWIYPNVDGLIINYIDTVFLQWESDFSSAYLQMWCQNGTTGNNVVLGSQSPVVTTGRFGYVLTNQDPAQSDFPVACHAALVPDPTGGGVDAPFGLTFTSQLKVAAQTFTVSTGTTSSSSTTTTASSSSTTTSSAIVSSATIPESTTSSISSTQSPIPTTSSSPSILLASPTGSTASSTSIPPSTASSAPASSSTANNDLGPIIGGILGGLALLCFIIFGAMFLRRYRRDPDDEKKVLRVKSQRSWWPRYRTTPMQTGGLHEIEGSTNVRHEKEGSTPAVVRYEKEGDLAKRHEIGGRAKSMRWTVAELPS